MEAFGGLVFVVGSFALVLGVLWFFLPFAVFGTKAKLDVIIIETKRSNVLLETIASQQSVLVQQQKLALTRQAPPVPTAPSTDSLIGP